MLVKHSKQGYFCHLILLLIYIKIGTLPENQTPNLEFVAMKHSLTTTLDHGEILLVLIHRLPRCVSFWDPWGDSQSYQDGYQMVKIAEF